MDFTLVQGAQQGPFVQAADGDEVIAVGVVVEMLQADIFPLGQHGQHPFWL